jgi:hypothetical protein
MFSGIDIVLFLVTAYIGFSMETSLPGGPMLSPLLSCFLAADLGWLTIFFLGMLGIMDAIMLRWEDFLWLGAGAASGCFVGMILGGVFGGYTGLVGPILGGVGAVLALNYRLIYI